RLRVRWCRWMRRRRGPDLQRREWIGHALQEIWLSLPGLGGKCRGSLLVLSGEPVFDGEGVFFGAICAVVSGPPEDVCELVGVDGLECGSCISSVQFGCLPAHLPVVSDRLGGAFYGCLVGHWFSFPVRWSLIAWA